MLDSIRFVQGAVARKDFVAALTHYRIKDGSIRGHNGAMTLCAPIDLDLDVIPKATSFTKAVQMCGEGTAIQLHVTGTGRLSVKSGKFRALVDCVSEGYPDTEPEGTMVELDKGSIRKALKVLEPFIADDASRPWARGILFRGQSAFATNNVVLVEHWLGYDFPVPINIPHAAVNEMIRIPEDPKRMQVSPNSVTFFYEGGRWLKTTLYSLEWPDLAKVLDRPFTPGPVPEGLMEALESCVPFVDKLRRIHLREGGMTTDPTDQSGAAVEVEGVLHHGIYNIDYLMGILAHVKEIDFSGYPAATMFYGDGLRGAIIGMRG